MSDNTKSTDMIDAVLAGLPKEDGDNDAGMGGATNDDLEPGQIPPWEDVMDVESTAQTAKSVDSVSTPTPAAVSASPKPPSAQGGRSMSTALSVSSTPQSDRVQLLTKSATPNGRRNNVSGIFSFNGSPSTRPAANTKSGRPMGALAFRPPNPVTAPNSPRNAPRGPAQPSPSRRGQGGDPGLPQAPTGPGQSNGVFGFQGPNRQPQSGSHGRAQVSNQPSRGGGSGLALVPNRPSQSVGQGLAHVSNQPAQGVSRGVAQAAVLPGQGAGPRILDVPGYRVTIVGGPRPARPEPQYSGPTPTAVLSRECQRRHFNPEWKVSTTAQGRFACDVRVGSTWIRGKTTWKDTITAKYAMAIQAIPVVKQMPVANTTQPPGFQKEVIKKEAQPGVKQEQGAGKQQPGNSLYTPPSRREHPGTKATMLNNISVGGSLMTHLQHSLGVSVPSNSNPEVTKAFLEGVALGSRLGASLDAATRGRRGNSRSCSPAASRRADRYRVRSPPPNARNRSTPPPVYADYPGRPSSDHYRPTDSAIPRDRPRDRPPPVVAQPPARPALVANTGINGEWWGHDGYYRMNRIKTERQD